MARVWFVSSAIALLAGTAASAGAQDGFGGWSNDGLVRDQARAGYVPRPDAFRVEGLLAEHHFPAREQRCVSRFCVLGAMGHGMHRPSGQRSAYLVVEPVSGFDPQTFDRAPLELALVIDRSGSMQGWKLDAAKQAAHVLIEKLDERDQLSIVVFDERSELHLPLQSVTDRAALHDVVEAIEVRGSTNIHDAMTMGYAQLATESHRAQRVVLLTDERPNVGPTGTGRFLELIGSHAGRVGLTVVGVGLDLGADLADAMAQIEGGAMHYLEGPENAATLFEDLRRFVAPVAYGLSVNVQPGPGLRVAEVFGVPADRVTIHPDGSATFRASTVFFDPIRRGAVVRMAPVRVGSDAALRADATIRFSYRLPETGERYRGQRSVSHRSTNHDAVADMPSAGAYLAYALVSYAEQFRAGLDAWHQGESTRAIRHMTTARHFLSFDRSLTREAQLDDERDTIDRVLAAMGVGKN